MSNAFTIYWRRDAGSNAGSRIVGRAASGPALSTRDKDKMHVNLRRNATTSGRWVLDHIDRNVTKFRSKRGHNAPRETYGLTEMSQANPTRARSFSIFSATTPCAPSRARPAHYRCGFFLNPCCRSLSRNWIHLRVLVVLHAVFTRLNGVRGCFELSVRKTKAHGRSTYMAHSRCSLAAAERRRPKWGRHEVPEKPPLRIDCALKLH